MKLILALIEHKHGINSYVGLTRQDVEDQVIVFVQEYWDYDEWGEMPSDDSEAIDAYFDNDLSESIVWIEDLTIPTKVNKPTHPGATGTIDLKLSIDYEGSYGPEGDQFAESVSVHIVEALANWVQVHHLMPEDSDFVTQRISVRHISGQKLAFGDIF